MIEKEGVMDIQSKIAARRAELAKQDRDAQQDARAQAKAMVSPLEATQGPHLWTLDGGVETAIPKSSAHLEEALKREVNRLARSRFSTTENGVVGLLLVGGIVLAFNAFWLGMAAISASVFYAFVIRAGYKEQIHAELNSGATGPLGNENSPER